jgi:RNA polymerase sigma-70 factor (ECF subfamily)
VTSEELNKALPAQTAVDLGERLRRGDESSLGEVLRLLGPIAAGGLRGRYAVLNWQDVEDILAIALYRLWKFRGKFDPAKASLKSLFCRIADNTAKNLFRDGWQKVRQREVELDAAISCPAVTAAEQGNPGCNEILEVVREVLAKLPEAYRHIILADAYAWDRVAESELLAAELEIPAGTVRVYRNRALAAVRSELRKRGYEVP